MYMLYAELSMTWDQWNVFSYLHESIFDLSPSTKFTLFPHGYAER